jgi:hypothetical protein
MYGQIQVNSSGNVGIKKNASTTYAIDINGKMNISGGNSVNLIIDKYSSSGHNFTAIRPSQAWYATLGTPSHYFGYSYIKAMRSQECLTETLRSNSHINNYGYTFSDRTLKTNIRGIESPISLLSKLEGKKYDITPPATGLLSDEKVQSEKKDEYGFIAQDFINVLPELVLLDSLTGLYAINYTGLIPIIIEALKEQDKINKSLSEEIERLKAGSTYKSATIEDGLTPLETGATLAQNVPNPFSDNTRIDITLPETIKNARLYVYNMQGVQINSFNINERGATSVTIEGFTLEAGLYLYTLIADGKEVDTKKMILTK